MKRAYKKLLYLFMSAITTTRLVEVKTSVISVGNEHTDTLIFTTSIFGKVLRTFKVKKTLHFRQHAFKKHWDLYDKLIKTGTDVGAIWLPFIKIE